MFAVWCRQPCGTPSRYFQVTTPDVLETRKAMASSRGPSPYADVLRKREERNDPGPPVHDLNWLLGMYGPYYVSPDVTETEIFQTLDGFGLAIWQVESLSYLTDSGL